MNKPDQRGEQLLVVDRDIICNVDILYCCIDPIAQKRVNQRFRNKTPRLSKPYMVFLFNHYE